MYTLTMAKTNDFTETIVMNQLAVGDFIKISPKYKTFPIQIRSYNIPNFSSLIHCRENGSRPETIYTFDSRNDYKRWSHLDQLDSTVLSQHDAIVGDRIIMLNTSTIDRIVDRIMTYSITVFRIVILDHSKNEIGAIVENILDFRDPTMRVPETFNAFRFPAQYLLDHVFNKGSYQTSIIPYATSTTRDYTTGLFVRNNRDQLITHYKSMHIVIDNKSSLQVPWYQPENKVEAVLARVWIKKSDLFSNRGKSLIVDGYSLEPCTENSIMLMGDSPLRRNVKRLVGDRPLRKFMIGANYQILGYQEGTHVFVIYVVGEKPVLHRLTKKEITFIKKFNSINI